MKRIRHYIKKCERCGGTIVCLKETDEVTICYTCYNCIKDDYVI